MQKNIKEMAKMQRHRENLRGAVLELLSKTGGSFPKNELWNKVASIYGKIPKKKEFGFQRMEEIFDFMKDVVHIDTSGDKPLVVLNSSGDHSRTHSDTRHSVYTSGRMQPAIYSGRTNTHKMGGTSQSPISLSTSSSDSDSDSDSSNVRVTRVVEKTQIQTRDGAHLGSTLEQKDVGKTLVSSSDLSGFLSLDVPCSNLKLGPQQSMIFSNNRLEDGEEHAMHPNLAQQQCQQQKEQGGNSQQQRQQQKEQGGNSQQQRQQQKEQGGNSQQQLNYQELLWQQLQPGASVPPLYGVGPRQITASGLHSPMLQGGVRLPLRPLVSPTPMIQVRGVPVLTSTQLMRPGINNGADADGKQQGIQRPAQDFSLDHTGPDDMSAWGYPQQSGESTAASRAGESTPASRAEKSSVPPHPLAPQEPTWPPSASRLGMPPGVPRERKPVSWRPVSYMRGHVTKTQLEGVAQDCIEILAETGDFVSPERVLRLLLERFQVRDVRDLQVPGVRFPHQIDCINQHERLLCKVNASIEAFSKSRSLCTLHELSESLEEFAPDKGKFETLGLGPLQCLPEVYKMFKFPQDENIPEITTADVLEVLSEYLTKNSKWTSKLELEDVMLHFMKHYDVSSAYSLGIRIRSLPLVTQVLKKSHRDSAGTRRIVVQRFRDIVEKEVAEAFRKVKATILQETSEGGVEIRQHYARMNAEAVVVELMQKFRLLLSLFTPESRAERKRHDQVTMCVTQFCNVVSGEPLARMLLHLAVCVGVLELQESAMELLAGGGATRGAKGSEDTQGSTEQPKPRQPPSKEALMAKLKNYIERCLAQGPVTLSHLDRIEEKLLEDFGFSTFVALGFGRFLNFLVQDPAPKALLEECGGIALGTMSSGHSCDSGLIPSMTEVLEFVRQCHSAGITQDEEVEGAMCHQFQVREARLLGYGNMGRLTAAADKPGKHHSKDYHVLCEAALCGKNSESVRSKREVGILGSQSKEAALACLQSCPLLEDLESWSHWSLVFEPQHGRLRDFLQKYGGVHTMRLEGGQKIVTTDVVALEIRQGCLLRLVTNTSPTLYQGAVSQGDARAASGHLASLLVANRGTRHLPLTLLANHTRAALYALHASASTSVPGGPLQVAAHDDPAVQFVLACLLLLPLRLCVAVADQLFLEPLGQVLGSSRSKTLLLQACIHTSTGTGWQAAGSPWAGSRHLARLGCLLGVQEWIQPLTETFTFPAENVTLTMPHQPQFRDELQEEAGAEEEMEEESESESESDEACDAASFLSDEQDEDPDVKPDADLNKATAGKQMLVSQASSEEGTSESDEEEEEEDEEEEDAREKDAKEDAGEVVGSEGEDLDSGEKTQEDSCRQVIEQIQHDEFGVGIELSEDGQRLMKVQQERLGRSLDRLSRDLYSKDTHFVLELVQNADDNTYPESLTQAGSIATSGSVNPVTDCPSVKFVIEADQVTVLNNECGFQEQNVRALCDVGRSTKGKHKYGYIGQKGIGFKSVFRVTNRPEVHSNGFHFYFDVDSGPMGYILPHWCCDNDPSSEWMTKIVLPLKETKMSAAGSLSARFNDIHPSLLLFLHRLRYIHIDNKVEQTNTWMWREDVGDNVVQIEHGDKEVQRWLVIRKQLDASAISLQAKSGVEVESTEIALAFPLTSRTQRFRTQAPPAKQPVFAFLPLRSYGFRFIVQGDFDVPSSREDVDRDSSWNQWLRDEIHTLFVEALDVFKSHPEFEGLESLWAYLRFVPLQDEILDFFRPVATRILQQLRATPCMPIATSSGSKKGVGDWKIPSQTVMVKDSLVREVISPELLERHLGLYYAHKEAAELMSVELARSLGVESITSEHLVQMGKSLALAWGQQVGQDDVTQIAKWLACIYRSLDDLQENTALISVLQGMNVIPLSAGDLVSLAQTTVFLMSSDQEERGSSGIRDALSMLQQDLQVVHSGLVTTPDAEVNSQVLKLLMRLGVKQLSPHDIIHHHILPTLQSDRWQTKRREVLVSYLVYIKQQYSKDPSLLDISKLKAVARVLTNQGIKNPATEAVHFSPAFGTSLDLMKELPGHDWVIIDSQYLPSKPTHAELQGWQDFLAQLGVAVFLVVQPRRVTFTADQLPNTPWAPFKDTWPTSQDGYTIKDFVCEEFQQLVSNNSAERTQLQQMSLLFSLLDKSWNSRYLCFAETQLFSSSETLLKSPIPSSFAVDLQNEHWVPAVETVVITAGGQARVEKRQLLLPPSVLYLPDPGIINLMAHTVNYLSNHTSSDSTFARFLRIKSQVEVPVVRDALISWGKRAARTPDEPATFVSSLRHMKTVYEYLCENLTPKDAQDLFHHHPVIFVPLVKGEDRDLLVGHMLGRDEVWWQDPSGLFNKYRSVLVEFHSLLAKRRSLSALYSEMSDTLPRTARLQREPDLVDYAELLLLLSSSCSVQDNAVLEDVLSIYAKIGRDLAVVHPQNSIELMQQQKQAEKIKDILKSAKVLVTKSHEWVASSDRPMLADSVDLEKMFFGKPGVHFVVLELARKQGMRRQLGRDSNVSQLDDILAFYELFSVPQLSEEVKKEEVVGIFKPYVQGQLYLRGIVPFLQQFLVSLFPAVHEAHEKDSMADRLRKLLFVADKQLEVKYSLKALPDIFVIKPEKCVITGSHFYFNEKHVESLVEVNREVAHFFSNGNNDCFKEMRNFLTDLQPLVQSGSVEEIAQLLTRHGVGPLPEGIEPWEVPAPVLPKPSPRPPPAPQAVPVEQFSKAEPSGVESVEDGDAKPSLKSWPPVAPGEDTNRVRGVRKTESEGRTPASSGVWPPPKPPDGTNLHSNLPSNLHMASTPSDRDKSREQGNAGTSSRGECREASEDRGGTAVRGRAEAAGEEATTEGRQQDSSHAGKRKSHELDVEVSESKRPAPTERVGSDGLAQPASSQLAGAQNEDIASSGAKQNEGSCRDNGDTPTDFGDHPGHRTESRNAPMETESRGEARPRLNIASRNPYPPFRPRPDQLQVPVWTELACETEYEELARGKDLKIPESIKLTDTSDRDSVGRWGECLVYDYLVQQKKINRDIHDVIWTNELEESGKPYDFEVICVLEDEAFSLYIEVKATRTSAKEVFEISSNEVKCALENGERYHIYRVFNAGTMEVQLVRLTNVAHKMDSKEVRLLMVM